MSASLSPTSAQRVRFSHLRELGRSPAHCYLQMTEEEREPSDAMRIGQAVHVRILGGVLPEPEPAIVYPGIRRGKEWEAFKAENAGARILIKSEYEREQASLESMRAKVDKMALAIERNKLAHDLLTDGVNEETLLFDHVGRACRATPDTFRADRVVELKTTVNADPNKFHWDAIRRSYHAQLAWYTQAVALSGRGQPKEAHLVAVESSAPWPVVVWRLTPQALDRGLRQCRLWLERFLACEASNAWPGYCESSLDFAVEDDDVPLNWEGMATSNGDAPF